ncbi:MAG: N-acetylmuramoyl-L-alanine amidase [Bacteroidales bacterium]|nr:N-acetylmuramoyl-L-alanine amidase [Bacteroidales bacterium]
MGRFSAVSKGLALIFIYAALLLGAGGITASAQNSSDIRLKTVVIDAGHGGKDAGAISKDKKTYEKNITLAIAKAFGKKIEDAYPDVKVIYTRTTDVFVELGERAAIANRNKADLFVSVHINSNESASPSGFSAHILGQSSNANRDLFSANLELSKRENSVILLEEDYDTKYQGFDPQDSESLIFFNLMQNAYYEQSILFAADVVQALGGGPIKKDRGISQNPFLVLWRTTMPAVLLELGFISNVEDLKVLNSTTGRDQIAGCLFEAFRKFKTEYDGSLEYTRTVPAENTAGEEVADTKEDEATAEADSTAVSTGTEGDKGEGGSRSKRTRTRRSSNGALLFPDPEGPAL